MKKNKVREIPNNSYWYYMPADALDGCLINVLRPVGKNIAKKIAPQTVQKNENVKGVEDYLLCIFVNGGVAKLGIELKRHMSESHPHRYTKIETPHVDFHPFTKEINDRLKELGITLELREDSTGRVGFVKSYDDIVYINEGL